LDTKKENKRSFPMATNTKTKRAKKNLSKILTPGKRLERKQPLSLGQLSAMGSFNAPIRGGTP